MVKQLFYSIETTHRDTEIGAICHLAGIIVIDGRPVETFDWTVRPHPYAVIDRNMLLATGTDVDALMSAESPRMVFGRLREMLRKYVNPKACDGDKIIVCDYGGGKADNRFLSKFIVMHRADDDTDWFWHTDIDVRQLAADSLIAECQGLGDFDKWTVAEKIGIKTDPNRRYDTLYNAWLVYEIYRRISNNYAKSQKGKSK